MNRDNAISDPRQDQQTFSMRAMLSVFILLGLTSIVLFRYFDLQINRHHDYVTNSNKNRIHILFLHEHPLEELSRNVEYYQLPLVRNP